jgi:aarF domain-containing kinase
VHRAVLSARGAAETGYPEGMMVAVKVRHPGVSERMESDFALMERVAQLLGQFESLQWIRLDESIRQFGAPMRDQLDLRNEARNLDRFNENFRRWSECWFPQPLRPLVTADVLVETFEHGDSVSRFVEGKVLPPSDPAEMPLKSQICSIGVNLFFKMVLNDNYVHGDMHPGNVLVMAEPDRLRTPVGRALNSFVPWKPVTRVVMLDAGMAFSLSDVEQKSVMNFFQACTQVDGEAAAACILQMGHQSASATRKQDFVRAMRTYFAGLDEETMKNKSAVVIQDVMEMVQKNRICVSGEVSSLLVQMFVLEGWASNLDREVGGRNIHSFVGLLLDLSSCWFGRAVPPV